MSTFQNLTQFAPTPGLGQPMKGVQPSTFAVRLNPTSVATGIQVGTPLKLVANTATSEIVVDVAGPTDAIFAVIPANTKKNTYLKGDVLDVFSIENTLLLESTAAINAGDLLKIGNTSATGGGPGVTTTTVVGTQIGAIALTSVSAAQQLVLVKIRTGVVPATQIVTSTGTVVLVAGTANMAGLALTAASQILFTLKTVGGVPAAAPYLSAINAGAGTATVKADAADTSTYNYRIIG